MRVGKERLDLVEQALTVPGTALAASLTGL